MSLILGLPSRSAILFLCLLKVDLVVVHAEKIWISLKVVISPFHFPRKI